MSYTLELMIWLHAFAAGLVAVSVVCGLTAAGIVVQSLWEWFRG